MWQTVQMVKMVKIWEPLRITVTKTSLHTLIEGLYVLGKIASNIYCDSMGLWWVWDVDAVIMRVLHGKGSHDKPDLSLGWVIDRGNDSRQHLSIGLAWEGGNLTASLTSFS